MIHTDGRATIAQRPTNRVEGDPMLGGHDIGELEDIMSDGIATLDCGCTVEPDGRCPCGNESPLLELGLI